MILRKPAVGWLMIVRADIVAHLLGHSSTKMVETVYGHLGNENYRNAATKLPALPRSAGSQSVVTRSARQASEARPHRTEPAAKTRKPARKNAADGSSRTAVPGAGIEPATRGFSVRCSTN